MKRTVISMGSRTEHHLLSGRLYHIDRRLERQGSTVYLDRNYVRHESIASVRSILLPDQNIWVMFFEGHAGDTPLNCYMHMCRVLDDGSSVTVEDLYLDVLVKHNGNWQLVDVDEFRRAVASGELSSAQVEAALYGLENACRLVDRYGTGIEAHLHSLLTRA